MTKRDVAKIAYTAVAAYQRQIDGSACVAAWDDLPLEIQHSTVRGVEKALTGVTPEEMHEAWCADRKALGWVHGSEKNFEKKTHPNLVAYLELPAAQRLKDSLFLAVIRVFSHLLEGVGED